MSRLLSLRSVATKLDVSTVTVRRWLASGEFPRPVIMPGGGHRWHEAIVEIWMSQRPGETPVPEEGVKGKKA